MNIIDSSIERFISTQCQSKFRTTVEGRDIYCPEHRGQVLSVIKNGAQDNPNPFQDTRHMLASYMC